MPDLPPDSAPAPSTLRRLGGYLRRAAHAARFPLSGVVYFCRHREYHPLFFGRLLPLALISFFVYFILFAFTFLPQFAFLAIFHGWGAWVNALFLVLGEGLVITQALFEGFFVDEARVDVFDATLIDSGYTDLVAPQRLLFVDAPDAVRMLGKPTVSAAYQPWSLVQIIELIFCLPLNFIPYIGTPAFIIITGSRLGKLSHYRWYSLRGLSRKERRAEIARHAWDYTWFGTVAMLLQLVPVLSFFFLVTSTTGSALWAAELEGARRLHDQEAERRRRQLLAGASILPEAEPPHYEDDPV
ncbi:protein family [Ophiostoma piceae UAMH 11346]|uniref:Protein family n=1 Tax=Ophiostoma piceae (strain UAMH 11346) TaxID=1262450 RepID=S3CDL0_OPHP1|nr:protein family [Ophiostoma piceae UAMH 11346]